MLAKEHEMKEEIKYSSKAIPLRDCNHRPKVQVDRCGTHRHT